MATKAQEALQMSVDGLMEQIKTHTRYRPGTTRMTINRHLHKKVVEKLEAEGFKVKKKTKQVYGRSVKQTRISW